MQHDDIYITSYVIYECHLMDVGNFIKRKKKRKKISGLVRESNPGPLAPKARIMPLDQPASVVSALFNVVFVINTDACVCSAWLQARHNIDLFWPMNVILLHSRRTILL